MKVKVDNPLFWQRRLSVINRRDWDFLAVWHTTVEEWEETILIHRELMNSLIPVDNACKVLDAGCGQGHMLDILKDRPSIKYTGIDISPEFIKIASTHYPQREFILGDLRSLPYPSQHFDFAVARSVEGMICNGLGADVWRVMELELLRVSKCVILLNYTNPKICKVLSLQSITDDSQCFEAFFSPDAIP